MGSYGDEAIKLIRELKRQHDVIPPYRDQSVRDVVAETRYLHGDLPRIRAMADDSLQDAEADESQTEAVLAATNAAWEMHRMAIQRNKRCLLAYHRERLDRIRDAAWELGGGATAHSASASASRLLATAAASTTTATTVVGGGSSSSSNSSISSRALDAGMLPPDVGRNLSPSEHEFLNSYRGLVEKLKGRYLDVDLGGPLVPPKDIFVDVRVMKDLGDVVMGSGAVVRLAKGSQHTVRRSDVEQFITRGYLKQL
ncbi:hypothetical protein DFJ73DRAFT_833890 [Zopfochytrium polystomum]|nr:hypothetical protein DFJ73DRAFT_833890 [Zopfochytrium polystomum]